MLVSLVSMRLVLILVGHKAIVESKYYDDQSNSLFSICETGSDL